MFADRPLSLRLRLAQNRDETGRYPYLSQINKIIVRGTACQAFAKISRKPWTGPPMPGGVCPGMQDTALRRRSGVFCIPAGKTQCSDRK